ncbi:hypothetical protein QLX67_10860 [Balneolaceae bacterium ANBcel3]|nr:hypothetical protein [Balneolaceae bacterium ANBcel3]
MKSITLKELSAEDSREIHGGIFPLINIGAGLYVGYRVGRLIYATYEAAYHRGYNAYDCN